MADVEKMKLKLILRAIKGLKLGLIFVFISVVVIVVGLLYFVLLHRTDSLVNNIVIRFFDSYEVSFIYILSWQGLIFWFPVILAMVALGSLIYKNRKKIIRANTPLF